MQAKTATANGNACNDIGCLARPGDVEAAEPRRRLQPTPLGDTSTFRRDRVRYAPLSFLFPCLEWAR